MPSLTARSGSWFRPPSTRNAATVAAGVGVVLFAAAWALLHTGFWTHFQIVDTPVYQAYGDAMLAGRTPYRDFAVEYPPGALPVFVLPSFAAAADYRHVFELLMFLCGGAAVVVVAFTLSAVGASARRLYAGVGFVALAPLALGSVVLTRYDLWPAALAAGALAALAAGRDRVAFGTLGAAVAAKAYPLVVLPVAVVYVARRGGRREGAVALGVFAAVLAAIVVPWAVLSPGGVADSVRSQLGRPLQIESLGASLLLAAHQLGVYDPTVVSGSGSQNLAGPLPDALATVGSALLVIALLAVWALFATGPATFERLLTASAASVGAFVAFAKVVSPQYLIWLVPLVPAVARRAGLAAGAVFGAALVVTQLWFPSRYWDVVALEPVGWLVLARDLLLVALFAVLVYALARTRDDPDTGSDPVTRVSRAPSS